MNQHEPTIHKSVYFGDMPYSHLGLQLQLPSLPSSHHGKTRVVKVTLRHHPTIGNIISCRRWKQNPLIRMALTFQGPKLISNKKALEEPAEKQAKNGPLSSMIPLVKIVIPIANG